jgi:hypothetical protein
MHKRIGVGVSKHPKTVNAAVQEMNPESGVKNPLSIRQDPLAEDSPKIAGCRRQGLTGQNPLM